MAKTPDIPTQIVRAREAAGLTQAQLAEKVGLKQSGIAHFEVGGRPPNLSHLEAIATALRCTFVVGPGAWPKGDA